MRPIKSDGETRAYLKSSIGWLLLATVESINITPFYSCARKKLIYFIIATGEQKLRTKRYTFNNYQINT